MSVIYTDQLGSRTTGIALTITNDMYVSGILTCTGSVTVGGTLTYEDVTNIDSVGLITARDGINVSGGQIAVGSNIQLGNAGVVTATSYKGDGSALTGISAGLSTDEYENTSGGIGALDSMSAGNATDNTAIGYDALTANTTGDYNTGIGASALAANTTGGGSVAVGMRAGKSLTTGGPITAVGQNALAACTVWGNTAVGYYAAAAVTTGGYNTAMGNEALEANTTGANNSAFGHRAL